MTALRGIAAAYGGIIAAFVAGSTALWVVLLILLPQIIMADYSLWRPTVPADRTGIEKELDEAYIKVQLIELKLKKADPAADKPGLESERDALRRRIAELEATITDGPEVGYEYTAANYLNLGGRHLPIFVKTLLASAAVTVLALLVCYPIVYYIAKVAPAPRAALIIMGLIVPYWVNEILRTFAWLMILSYNGLLNTFLQATGITEAPVMFLSGNAGVLIGMIYAYILFMVFPIYNTLETLDGNQLEAARDLGAPWWGIHRDIIIPHAKPGIAIGCILTFMLSAGSYAVPAILGGTTGDVWFTQIIYNQFMASRNWNVGSAYSILLLVVCLAFVIAVMRIARVRLQDMVR
ncbi:MAG TPA: ABC transporter permease [Nordella sp.]|nr:ABC transporter permease [Nordella sp.]